jgi:polygalacturonase
MRVPISVRLCIGLSVLTLCTGSCRSADFSANQQIDQGVRTVLENIHEPQIPDRTINLIEFSKHKPDETGKYDFHADIQRAIETLSEQGGGKLLFAHTQAPEADDKPIVVYRIKGPIEFKSNIELSIAPSVKLQFEFDPPSYLPGGKGVLSRYEGTTLYTRSPLIRAFNVQNISIRAAPGTGALPEINGDGKRWRQWEVDSFRDRGAPPKKQPSYMNVRTINDTDNLIAERRYDKEFLRPDLIGFFLCKQIRIEGIKIANSPFWCVHPVFSENMTFRGITFEALVENNDGVDPESSRYVLIEDITFHNGDDNVAIKSGRNTEGRKGARIAGTELETIQSPYIHDGRIGGPTEYVLVRNCRFRGHYAMCIGSEMSGGARYIYVLDNVSTEKVNMGFYIKGGRERGGTVSDVYVRNMHLNEVQKDVICLIPNYDGDTVSPYPSKFKNIYIEDITARHAKNGIRIYGWPDQTIDNVTIRNVKVDKVDEVPFGINHVKGVFLQDVIINGQPCDGEYNNSNDTVPTPRAG